MNWTSLQSIEIANKWRRFWDSEDQYFPPPTTRRGNLELCVFDVVKHLIGFRIHICGDFAESEYRDLKGSYGAFRHLGTFDPFLSELAVETASAYSGHWFSGHSFHFEFTSSAPGPPTRDLIASMCCISQYLEHSWEVQGCPGGPGSDRPSRGRWSPQISPESVFF